MTASRCLTCEGTGTVEEYHAAPVPPELMRCDDCRGLGYVVPADPTNADLDAVVAARQGFCPTCQNHDGSPNVAYLMAHGSCTFGCGSVISWDELSGNCIKCGDHSANECECEGCGRTWADWMRGRWEVQS